MSSGSGMGRKSLGRRLAALREQSGKTYEDVKKIGSRQKIWRMEAGKPGPYKFADIQALCFVYGADEATMNALVDLAEKITSDNVFEDYNDVVMPGFGVYLDLEANAREIDTYDPELVHGLLQIPEYHEVIVISDGNNDVAVRQRAEELRQERQRRTMGRYPDPCQITAILGEAALYRIIGSSDIMNAQLSYLRRLVGDNGNVKVRILTWAAGAHAALRGGAFTLMKFSPPEPDIVYLESGTDARYLEKEPKLSHYRDKWAILVRDSVPLEEYAK
ncbi:MAG TPA: helix-turn-helix transcriptional regulator [Polyangia bacterium]